MLDALVGDCCSSMEAIEFPEGTDSAMGMDSVCIGSVSAVVKEMASSFSSCKRSL